MAFIRESLPLIVGLPLSSKRLAPALCRIIMIRSAEPAWPVSSGFLVLASTVLPLAMKSLQVISVKSATVRPACLSRSVRSAVMAVPLSKGRP